MTVAIAITVYHRPERLAGLLDNMHWAGLPDIPVYIVEDRPPVDGVASAEISRGFQDVIAEKLPRALYVRTPKWGCMQGSIQHALTVSTEDWIIYVPDDVRFAKGGLYHEYAAALAYGRDWVGCMQAPYWNATDLVTMGVLASREAMWAEVPFSLPRNPHWDNNGVPRKYINVNGAGFTINRRLFDAMGGWPTCTWRLDEWAGYQAWMHGMVCMTVPGPPRVHYFGGTTPDQPTGLAFHSVEAWQAATGGLTPAETGNRTVLVMDQLPEEDYSSMLAWFNAGNTLKVPPHPHGYTSVQYHNGLLVDVHA